jgi:hypothetical protein
MRYTPIPGVRAVIGLVGHARSGKDASAKLLLKHLPGAERFAFSDALSVECRLHHGMQARDPRMLQDVGIMFRQARPGVWLDTLYHAIVDRQPDVAIVTGVRFPDEAAMVRDMGGCLLRVTRVEPDGRRFIADDRNQSHVVERDIDAIVTDGEIVARSGDLAGLERQLLDWLPRIACPAA